MALAQTDKTYLLRQNENLFEATLNAFSSQPFAFASTNVIIKNAAYNKGSFYYRFKTKEDLYYALIDYVYTLDISIFRKRDIDLLRIDDFETLVKLLLEQMQSLWNLDPRYYQLLQQIYLESDTVKQGIKDNCITSIEERILHRITDISRDKPTSYLNMMLSTLNHLVYHYIDKFDQNNFSEQIKHITGFLSQNQVQEVSNTKDIIHIDELLHRLNYVVIQEPGIDISVSEKDTLSFYLTHKTDTVTNIRKVLKIKQVTLANVIESGLKKNLKDLTILTSLLNFDYANKSYHLLSNFQKMVLILTYLTFIGKDEILVDDVLEFLKPEEIKILLQDILPKIAKISKIVVIDCFIYPFYTKAYTLYLYKNERLDKLSLETLLRNISFIEVQYLDHDILKTKTFQDFSVEMLAFLRNHTIYHISSNTKLSFQDISVKGV